MALPSQDLYKRKHNCFMIVFYVFCLHVFLSYLLLHFCLLVYHVNKFIVYVAFVNNFNAKRCKSKTSVMKFFHFHNNILKQSLLIKKKKLLQISKVFNFINNFKAVAIKKLS